MSLTDDRKAEIEAPVEAALLRAIYGKKASTAAFELASQIELVGIILRDENGDPNFEKSLDWIQQEIIKRCAGWLLVAALTGHLEEVAKANERRPAANIACQSKVLEAYKSSIRNDGSPPTLAELRTQFLRKHHSSLLPREFVLRDMVCQTFQLPLSKAKRGRPKIRNRNR